MEKLVLFALLSWITGQPLVALLAVLLLSGAGYGYLSGRLFRIPRAVERWGTIRELQRTLRANPHDAAARSNLGRLLVEAGRPAAALPHLEAAAARMPDAPEALYYLGAARLGVGDGGGRPLVERALTLDPKLRYGEPHLALGDYHLRRGAPADAIAPLRAFTAINASSVEGRYKLARACLAADQRDPAREAVEDAIRAYRDSPPFRRREERLWRLRAGWLRRRL
ncbi:MAG TPA: tetratricopeptide repeat protein [Methylomirabilota bacterium]|nr:tetratricopeptide repeat protein [Methylomirabilota bacterium]